MPLDVDLPPEALLAALEHHQAGRGTEAEAGYRAVLAEQPEHHRALFFCGLLVLQRGLAIQAIALLASAATAQPGHAETWMALGNAHWQAGQPLPAITAWTRVLALRPDHLGARLNLAKAQAAAGAHGAAVAICHEATRRAPDQPAAHIALAGLLLGAGQPAAALAAAEAALALAPSAAEAHHQQGRALKALHRLPEAALAFRLAIGLAPTHAEALLALGNTVLALGDPVAAEQHCRAAIAANPALAEAHVSLGCLLTNAGRLPEAIATCGAAIALRPDLAEAQWNLGIAQLLAGDLSAGFTQYEWRKRHPAHAGDFRRPPQPEWQGEPLAGRRLLVLAEQGLGDALMFARYLPLLTAQGAEVVLACDRHLLPLLAGIATAVPMDRPLPACDFWLDQMSLPLRFGTTLASIPSANGYLHADPARVAAWKARLPRPRPHPSARRIGLVWAGNPRHSNDAARSCPVRSLRPLTKLAPDQFISMQVGGAAAEAGELGLADLSSELPDWAATAALLAACDLLITVDTAVAHCAGALGKPVWLMLPQAPDWRWLLGRADTPWYASTRLFRQPVAGDWSAVVAQISQALASD